MRERVERPFPVGAAGQVRHAPQIETRGTQHMLQDETCQLCPLARLHQRQHVAMFGDRALTTGMFDIGSVLHEEIRLPAQIFECRYQPGIAGEQRRPR